ncbi:hypothetical protein Syun_027965 [Stephania yunnanensis]|uniref:Uncharacterized protein n=1 Tax=Stephania yunnanensis TaxID=152371 RepID=A0AAP0EQF2_9MAGN
MASRGRSTTRWAETADGRELQRPAATRAGELAEAATARRRPRGCYSRTDRRSESTNVDDAIE